MRQVTLEKRFFKRKTYKCIFNTHIEKAKSEGKNFFLNIYMIMMINIYMIQTI